MAQANIKAIISADDRASRVIQGFGAKTGITAQKIKAGVTIASAAIIGFGVSAVKSFSESEDSITQLNAVLKSTKGIAGVTSKAALDLANSLQEVTKFSDEEILSAESLLLTFTRIGKDIFPQAIGVVLDMSTALGQDLKSSAIQLGKALQDPILGVTALRRVGVNFDSKQRDVIKRLVETGHAAKAQALIMKELRVEFGGSAKAAGQTFSGQLIRLRNSFDEIKESIGKFIVEALSPYVRRVRDYIAENGPALEQNIKNIASSFVRATTFLIKHADIILALIAAYKSLKIALAIGDVIQGVGNSMAIMSARAAAGTAAVSLMRLGIVGLGIAAAGAVGFGIFKLIQHLRQSTVEAIANDTATRKLAGTYNIVKLSADNVSRAHQKLKDTKVAYKQAIQDLKKPHGDFIDKQLKLWATTVDLKNSQDDYNIKLGSYKRLLKFLDGPMSNIIAKFKDLAVQSRNSATGILQAASANDIFKGSIGGKRIQGPRGKQTLQGGSPGNLLQGGRAPGRALGGSVTAGRAFLVGEMGPEMFVPHKSGNVVPTSDLGGTGRITVNISPQIGVFAGSSIEMRRLSETILNSLKEVAASKGTTLDKMVATR